MKQVDIFTLFYWSIAIFKVALLISVFSASLWQIWEEKFPLEIIPQMFYTAGKSVFHLRRHRFLTRARLGK